MPTPLQAFAILLSVMVAISDLHARRVPNVLLLGALFCGALYLLLTSLSAEQASPWSSALGLVIGLAVLLPFYVVGWIGAGDVKFFAILGFLLGWQALLSIWVIASLLGGVHAIGILLARHWIPMQAWQDRHVAYIAPLQWAGQWRRGMPYAAYLATGAVVTVIFHESLTPWLL